MTDRDDLLAALQRSIASAKQARDEAAEQACDAGDTETADLIGAEADAVEEQVRQLRAALRGGDDQ